MNSKRWIAVGIAIVVFISSTTFSAIMGLLANKFQNNDFFSSMWDNTLQSEIIEEGNYNSRIVVLDVDGIIMQSTEDSFFSSPSYNHNNFLNIIEKVKNDNTIKGIVLNVNSPGGSVYECAQIRDNLLEIKQEKDIPIYAVMKSVAASGGYYISADAEKIYASADTLTGSIGVIMSGLNFAGLMEKYGVEDFTIKSGEYKDIGSTYRKPTEEDKKILQELIDSSYRRFVDVVSTGREMSLENTKKVADGRIYDGKKAKELGLIDELGYFEDALQEMRENYKLKNAQVFRYPMYSMNLMDLFNYKIGSLINGNNWSENLPSKMDNLEQPKMMYLYN